jgi:DNA-directed RNA polymerase subunit RPC12/RpoP
MTLTEPHLITHGCLNCGRHFALHQVRQVHPAEHTPEGEAEVLVCPVCGSYDPVPLSEVPNAG